MSNPHTVINRTILNNGLAVVSEHIPTARSVYFSVYIKSGSANEQAVDNGIAHFLEHMVFKGTHKRNAYEIASTLEDLGGNLNAYTGREVTAFYANVLSENLPQAIDVIADMLCNSLFTESDIEHEKLVVLEEINSIKDSPEEYIFDLFQEQLYPDQPLGRPILGYEETITNFKRSQIFDFKDNHYLSNNIVISAAGNLNHSDFVKMIEDKFCFEQKIVERAAIDPLAHKSKKYNFNRAANQVHICVGAETVSYNSEKKYDLIAINTYLGGGMSSRLFQKIREESGYAYTVYSSLDYYKETGVITFYLGTNKKNHLKALDILYKEIDTIRRKQLLPDVVDKIKRQMKGSYLLGLDDIYNRMSRLAKNEIYFERQQDVAMVLRGIDEITSDSIIETAEQFLNIDEFNLIQIS
jgi:predicted Zn-dependent peptidase